LTERLKAACQRALAFDEVSYRAVKGILTEGLGKEPLELELKNDIPFLIKFIFSSDATPQRAFHSRPGPRWPTSRQDRPFALAPAGYE
jgi:hypothetical protein